MKTEKAQIFIDLIMSLAYEIRDLMEANCENSGKIWLDKFIRQLPYPEDLEAIKK